MATTGRTGRWRWRRAHNDQSEASQESSDSSLRQIGVVGAAAEEPGSTHRSAQAPIGGVKPRRRRKSRAWTDCGSPCVGDRYGEPTARPSATTRAASAITWSPTASAAGRREHAQPRHRNLRRDGAPRPTQRGPSIARRAGSARTTQNRPSPGRSRPTQPTQRNPQLPTA